MEKRRRVAVYDNSLFMAGIITSLRADPTLEVFCVHPDSPEGSLWSEENDLAAVVFDLTEQPSHQPDIAALRNHPDVLMIGVDPTRDEILVLTGRSEGVLSIAGLLEMIRQDKPLPSMLLDSNKTEIFGDQPKK